MVAGFVRASHQDSVDLRGHPLKAVWWDFWEERIVGPGDFVAANNHSHVELGSKAVVGQVPLTSLLLLRFVGLGVLVLPVNLRPAKFDFR